MADIKSAAGEGSEPQVPDRDQPAQELANLIAQPDAKGKGFWRRRRRKTVAPVAEPTSEPRTDEPAPAATETTADADQATAMPTTGKSSTDERSTEPTADERSTGDPTADERSTGEPTADERSTGKSSGGAPVADEPSADEVAAEATARVPADDEAAADRRDEGAGAATGGESPAGEVPEGEPKTKSSAPAESAATEASDEPPAVEATAAESPADDQAAKSTASKPAETEPERPTVGVVYEPDESPDGFPMEYGDIIVGLPKNPAANSDTATDATTPADGELEADSSNSTSESADDKTDASPGAADDNADATPEAADDDAEAATEVGDEADATPEAGDGNAATATESADDKTAESSPDEPETAEEAVPAAEQVETAVDQHGSPDDADAASEEAVAAAETTGDASDERDADRSDPLESSGSAQDGDGQSADATVEGSSEQSDEAESAGAGPESSDATAEAAASEQADGEDIAGTDGARAESDGAEAGGERVDDANDAAAEDAVEQLAAAGDANAAEESAANGGAADDAEVADEGPAESAAAGDGAGAASGADAAGDADEVEKSAAEEDKAGRASAEAEAAGDGADAGDDRADAGRDAANAGDAEAGDEAREGSVAAGRGAGDSADDDVVGEDSEVAGGAVEELSAEQMAERVAAEQAAMALITALMRLRGALAASQLPIDVVGADEARQQQKAMLDQLDDYILPRLVQLEAPLLAVVGGSTGAGKSTLVNTIIGKVVSEPGVLRPTTRSPVLIHHPADADWFTGDRVLPGMARSSGDKPGGMEDPGQLRLVAADTVPQGLAILDAPDIDSVVEANRDLATQLLAAADLWLFVTTAARYADAVPWDFLQSASDRSTAVAVVLDRAPEDTIDDITGHLAQMLLERGLGDSPLFSIKETFVDGNGMLPAETVASIKDWLVDLAADAEARAAVVRRTLHGAVSAMVKKTPSFAAAVKAQAEAVVELRSTAETAYDRAVKDISKATQDGTLLRGEVLARWQEFVGTGELLKGLQTNVGRLRDKMKATVVGKPPPTRDLNDAVESGLESLLREHAEAAAERAEESWQSTAPGRQLLAAGDRDLGRMSKDFPAAAGRAVRDWQGYVLDLVRKEGADKRSTARILAYGVNGLGLSLMVVIFASTAGITGAEVGVGAGTAVVGQKLLEAVFGDQAVRTLVTKAREDLDGRVHALMDAEFARYLALLDQHPVDPEAARQLTEAARAVEDCT